MEITNPLTGQVYDLASEQDLHAAYCDMKAQAMHQKKFEAAVKAGMKEMLGNEESKFIVSKIYELKAQKSIRRSYPVSALKAVFDEDQLMECVKPINKKVEEMARILDADDRKQLENSMVVDSTSITYKIV